MAKLAARGQGSISGSAPSPLVSEYSQARGKYSRPASEIYASIAFRRK